MNSCGTKVPISFSICLPTRVGRKAPSLLRGFSPIFTNVLSSSVLYFHMRLWSLHPKYLDAKGLVALWRETLLAKNVLEGKTKGYKLHPQLIRFKKCVRPLDAVNLYLSEILKEAVRRNYQFDRKKIDPHFTPLQLTVTKGQMEYEKQHLLKKLKVRDKEQYKKMIDLTTIDAHSMFQIVDGDVEEWEKLSS